MKVLNLNEINAVLSALRLPFEDHRIIQHCKNELMNAINIASVENQELKTSLEQRMKEIESLKREIAILNEKIDEKIKETNGQNDSGNI